MNIDFPDESKDTSLQHHLRNVWHDNFNEQEFIDEMEAYIRNLFVELIGEDQKWDVSKKDYGFKDQGKNELRAELRRKVEAL